MRRCVAGAWFVAAWPAWSQVIAATACKAALHSETGAASGRYGKPYCRGLRGRGRAAVRGAAGDLDPASRALPALAERHQAERRHRLRKVVRGVALINLAAGAGLDEIDFNLALRSLRGCRGFLHGEEGSPHRDELIAAALDSTAQDEEDPSIRTGV